MALRDELPPRTGPRASRFDSDEALVKADDALRAAALESHDLSPILSFEDVYGPDMLVRHEQAPAIAIDPENQYSPDGEINYVYGDFYTEALVYGVYRPADGVSGAGPMGEDKLDEQELTQYLAQVYAYLYDNFPAMPHAPN